MHWFFGDQSTGVSRSVSGLTQPVAGLPPVVFLEQTHSVKIVTIEDDEAADYVGDALVTTRRGLGLGIKTADCAPVLLYDETANVIAAIHSGWQGTLRDIVTPTIAAMVAQGAVIARICTMIGPCLQRAWFEMQDDARQRFILAHPAYGAFFSAMQNDGKFLFDNAGLIIWQLQQNGVTQIEADPVCTLEQADNYYSFRARHFDAAHDTMRNISVIWQD